MKIEVKNLLKQSEGTSEIHPIALSNLDLKDAGTANVAGNITLTKLDDFILADITGKADVSQPCSRCLKEVILTIPLNFAREFKEEIPGPQQSRGRQARNDDNIEEEAYSIIDGQIDLASPIADEIIASLPVKILCQNTCKGLCPTCGHNLNDNPCTCDKVEFEVSNKIRFDNGSTTKEEN